MPVQRYPIEMHKDRRSWFEDMHWSATNTPVYDADGKLACVSHTTINITAQVLAEQALLLGREEALRNARMAEAERANLAAVLRAAPVGVLVVDRTLRVLHRNPAHEAMFGPELPDAPGQIDFSQWHGWFIDGEAAGRRLEPGEWPLQRACAGEVVDQSLVRVRAFTATPVENTWVLLLSSILATTEPLQNPRQFKV